MILIVNSFKIIVLLLAYYTALYFISSRLLLREWSVQTEKQSDMVEGIESVIDTAQYTVNAMLHMSDMFPIREFISIFKLESKLNNDLLEKLLECLVEVWAEMNARAEKGLRVLKDLRKKAKELLDRITKLGGKNRTKLPDFDERVENRKKQLLNITEASLCLEDKHFVSLKAFKRLPIFFRFLATEIKRLFEILPIQVECD